MSSSIEHYCRLKSKIELQVNILRETVTDLSEHISKSRIKRNRDKSDLTIRISSIERELNSTNTLVKELSSSLSTLMNTTPEKGHAHDILNFTTKMRPGTELSRRVHNQITAMRLQESACGRDIGSPNKSLNESRNEMSKHDPVKPLKPKKRESLINKRKVRFWEKSDLHINHISEYESIIKETNKHRKVKNRPKTNLI